VQKKIGFEISKVVFRGYHATDTLQSMHDNAIQARTQLRLQSETEEQAQSLADLKLLKEIQRATKKHDMEKQEVEHRNEISRKEHDSMMAQKVKEHDEEVRYYQNLKSMGVDLTKYMVSQFKTPEKLIQIQGSSDQSKFVLHTNE